MRNVGLGLGSFAMGGVGLAVLSFVYHDFAPMWHIFPASIPWRETWVYGTGTLVLTASAGLCFSRTALPSALTIGTYHAVWAVTQMAPIVFKPLSVGSWDGFCEALTPVLGAWLLYVRLRSQSRAPEAEPSIASGRAMRTARVLFALNCVVYGLAHFAYADFTASFVPTCC